MTEFFNKLSNGQKYIVAIATLSIVYLLLIVGSQIMNICIGIPLTTWITLSAVYLLTYLATTTWYVITDIIKR